MDIVRAPQKKTGRNIAIAAGVVVLAVATYGLSQMSPAAPSVDGAILLSDSVRRGDITRDVRGPGNLTPERVRWITPQTNGRIENVSAVNGQHLASGDVILVMSNPDQQIATTHAQQAVRQAQLDLVTLRNTLQTQRSNQEIGVAAAKTTLITAEQNATGVDSLVKAKVLAPFEAINRKQQLEEARTRYRVAQEQLVATTQTVDSQLVVAAANVDALKTIAANEEDRLRSLTIRAPEAGVLQQDALYQPGQWVQSGQTIGKIVQPDKLKAVLRIPESQAKDVQVGQVASIDTRNGLIAGHVSRKDPSATGGSVTVDVALEGTLPAGAVPDLSVDGTIILEKLKNVLYTSRPVSGAATGSVGLFKYVENGHYAVLTTVQLGRTSVNTVEIVSGLQPGDRVILSDMQQFENATRVRIK